MSDEILDPHSDGNVTSAGAAGLPAPEAKPEAKAEDTFKVSEDGNVAEHGGHKYVRQEALHQERQERQRLAAQLSQLEPLIPEINEFITAKQRRAETARLTAERGGPADDPEYLEEVAIALGFFNEQNQPDQRRAQAHLNISRREAQRVARETIEPIARTTTVDRAAANRERARAYRFKDGHPVAEDRYMDTAFTALGDQHGADPNSANLAQVVAAGLEVLDHRAKGTVPTYFRQQRAGGTREPMYTERGGVRVDSGASELSELDLYAARARGKSPEQWAKMTKSVGNDRLLEDVD